MKELETRVMDIDVDDIRNKMKSLAAIKVKSEDQVNEIYDFEYEEYHNPTHFHRCYMARQHSLTLFFDDQKRDRFLI